VCRRCEEDLRLWFKGKKNAFRFGIPMIWREQKNHTTDCYFCSVDCPIAPSYLSHNTFQLDEYSSELEDEAALPPPMNQAQIYLLTKMKGLNYSQGELNDLVRDLGLSKDAAEL
ncbi:Uncharacterized protein FKW44_025053, partial [Caligus rogercresseyi]